VTKDWVSVILVKVAPPTSNILVPLSENESIFRLIFRLQRIFLY